MLDSKRAYILLAAVFAMAVVVAVIWTFALKDRPAVNIAGSVNEAGEAEEAAAGPEAAADDKDTANIDRDTGTDSYPLVMRLLKSSQNRNVFGSFRLISVIVNDTAPGSSRATIEDVQTGSSRVYSVDDTLPDDSRLATIKRNYVILEKSGVRKRIYFDTPGGYSSGKNSSGGGRMGFKKISEGEYDLNPYRVFRGDAASVLDFSMKVHSRNGDMDGIQVSDVENNAMFRALGLQEGDVLVEVNGKPVDSLLNGVRACINAYYSDDVQLKVRRGGKIIPLTYHLFWEGQGSWTPTEVLRSRAISSLLGNSFASHLF